MTKDVVIKSSDIFLGILKQKFDGNLCDIVANIISKMHSAGITPVITSAYRPKDTNSVHSQMRGIDIRTHNLTMGFIMSLCNDTNTKWKYDPGRPNMDCLIYHDTGRGPHLHVQTHPNTIKVSLQ